MTHSGTDLQMARKLETPIVLQKLFEKFEKGPMGKLFKQNCQVIIK